MTYRCLYCDHRLRLHNWRAKRIDPVVCRHCKFGRYSHRFVAECDPKMWERCRHDKSFKVDEDSGVMFIEGGLGLHPKREKLKNATGSK